MPLRIFLEENRVGPFSTGAKKHGKSQRTYAIVFWFMLSSCERLALGEPAARFEMGMAIPRDAGWACGTATTKKGRAARKKECEKNNISERKRWDSKRMEEDC
jgi:hypothetical protein